MHVSISNGRNYKPIRIIVGGNGMKVEKNISSCSNNEKCVINTLELDSKVFDLWVEAKKNKHSINRSKIDRCNFMLNNMVDAWVKFNQSFF